MTLFLLLSVGVAVVGLLCFYLVPGKTGWQTAISFMAIAMILFRIGVGIGLGPLTGVIASGAMGFATGAVYELAALRGTAHPERLQLLNQLVASYWLAWMLIIAAPGTLRELVGSTDVRKAFWTFLREVLVATVSYQVGRQVLGEWLRSHNYLMGPWPF